MEDTFALMVGITVGFIIGFVVAYELCRFIENRRRQK